MTDAGKRLIAGANEALAVARGENPAASVTINGQRYVPAAEIERLLLYISEARATGRREEQDVVDKATAWDACNASFQKGRKAGMEEAARIAEGPAADWGDFSGGTPERDKIASAIRAAMEKAAGDPPVGNKDIGERHGDHH